MSSKKSTLIRLTARTDKGEVRYHNEDNFLIGSNLSTQDWTVRDEVFEASDAGSLLIVADGMGGANAGEVASQIAVDEVKNYFSKSYTPESEKDYFNCLESALFQGHKAIIKHAFDNPECEGMGTTLLLVWVVGTRAYIGWSGDSRCYKYHPNEGIQILIDDHSLVWEMVKKGELTEDEAAVHDERHIITQSLGTESYPPKPEFRSVELIQGDRLLLCSDGLNSMLLDSQIKAVLDQSDDITHNARQLIEAANKAGGEDNITVVMYELVEVDDPTAIEMNRLSRNPYQAPEKSLTNWVWILLLVLLVVAAGLGYWWWKSSHTASSQTTVLLEDSVAISPLIDTAITTVPTKSKANATSSLPTNSVANISKEIEKINRDKKNAEEQLRVNRTAHDKMAIEKEDLDEKIQNTGGELTKIENGNSIQNPLILKRNIIVEKIRIQELMIKEKQEEVNRLDALLKKNNRN